MIAQALYWLQAWFELQPISFMVAWTLFAIWLHLVLSRWLRRRKGPHDRP